MGHPGIEVFSVRAAKEGNTLKLYKPNTFVRLLMVAVVMPVIIPHAHASIISTTGDVVKISPPPSVRIDEFENDDEIRAFDERQDIMLPTDITVDIDAPGIYDDLGDLPAIPPTIPAGTFVRSHYLHSDPEDESLTHRYNGSATFDEDIIGVLLSGSYVTATHSILGAPGTRYGGGAIELGPRRDTVEISSDRRTITVQFSTRSGADRLRVITRGVPEPTCSILLAIGLLSAAAAYWRRRK